MTTTIHTGTLAHLRADPFTTGGALEIIPGGALAVAADGRILAAGERGAVVAAHPERVLVDHGSNWLIPGLIDGHLHFPQFYATAAPGADLLDWLERSILPAELAFADTAFAVRTAERFVARLLAAGTTTAVVFGSQFPAATEALFEAAARTGLRLVAGLTLMDRAGPPALLQTVATAVEGMERLIALCRDQPRLHYALTPRYPLACSPGLMEACADLLHRHPECYLQTHINEQPREVAAIRAAYPDRRDYLDVYDRYGLIGPRTLLAHSIHSTPAELDRMAEARCAVCHCPTSNLYLGSGLFPLRRHVERGIPVAVGTDIGAGTEFSVWRELAEAFKVQRIQGESPSAAELLYLATLGGARALGLDEETGNLEPGKDADFMVLNTAEDPYLATRLRRSKNLEDQLFALLHLAGESHVQATYVDGRRVERAALPLEPVMRL
jgi:guanine deaminase